MIGSARVTSLKRRRTKNCHNALAAVRKGRRCAFGRMPNNPAQNSVSRSQCLRRAPGLPACPAGDERQERAAARLKMKISRSQTRLALLAAIVAGTLSFGEARGAECWQGWGYLVDPKTLAFKSGQSLYVTDGPVDWSRREWIKLIPVDPNTGRRDKTRPHVLVRPKRPSQQGGGAWGDVVDDVANVLGSKWSMLLRLSHIAPSQHSLTLNDAYSRWACGYE